MKKVTAVIAAMAAAAAVSVSAWAYNIPLQRLGRSIEDLPNDEMIITAALKSSRSVKNHLILQSDEALIVPAGCKMTLKEGCTVFGTLFIEEGGCLAVSGGSLDICGCVVSDGTVSIGKNAALKVAEKGEMYVSGSGLFKSGTESVYFDENSTVACLGETSMSGCLQDISDTMTAKPVFAMNARHNPYTGGLIDYTQLDIEEAVKTVSGGYYQNEENPAGGYSEVLTIVFENGSAVKFLHRGDKLYSIGRAHIRSIIKYFPDSTLSEE
ncbi:MAG: hypothetical protein ACI4WS_07750 [Oscillospiraceae bacterium]